MEDLASTRQFPDLVLRQPNGKWTENLPWRAIAAKLEAARTFLRGLKVPTSFGFRVEQLLKKTAKGKYCPLLHALVPLPILPEPQPWVHTAKSCVCSSSSQNLWTGMRLSRCEPPHALQQMGVRFLSRGKQFTCQGHCIRCPEHGHVHLATRTPVLNNGSTV